MADTLGLRVYQLYNKKVSETELWTYLVYDVMKWESPLERRGGAEYGDETELHS